MTITLFWEEGGNGGREGVGRIAGFDLVSRIGEGFFLGRKRALCVGVGDGGCKGVRRRGHSLQYSLFSEDGSLMEYVSEGRFDCHNKHPSFHDMLRVISRF